MFGKRNCFSYLKKKMQCYFHKTRMIGWTIANFEDRLNFHETLLKISHMKILLYLFYGDESLSLFLSLCFCIHTHTHQVPKYQKQTQPFLRLSTVLMTWFQSCRTLSCFTNKAFIHMHSMMNKHGKLPTSDLYKKQLNKQHQRPKNHVSSNKRWVLYLPYVGHCYDVKSNPLPLWSLSKDSAKYKTDWHFWLNNRKNE